MRSLVSWEEKVVELVANIQNVIVTHVLIILNQEIVEQGSVLSSQRKDDDEDYCYFVPCYIIFLGDFRWLFNLGPDGFGCF